MIVDKEEAHFLVITPIPDDNTGWLYLLRKTFWIQVAYRVGTTYGQPYSENLAVLYCACIIGSSLSILRGHIFNFTVFIHLLSYLNLHCILHARSTCFVTKSLATCVPFQSPQRVRVMSPQVQSLALLLGKPALSFIS